MILTSDQQCDVKLKPFFTFYGGKWRCAPHYPSPEYDTIVEPFAGSAGYSIRHCFKNVILVEKDPNISATWRYLLNVSESEILSLPDIEMNQSVDDLNVCEEARLLIGWWLNGGSAQPKKKPGAWMRQHPRHGGLGWVKKGGGPLTWSAKVRERIAEQIEHIRHWRLIEDSYENAPDIIATWFVDPPYIHAGKHYRFGSNQIDYEKLGKWCRRRRGQKVVCENVGAEWLPFKPWREIKASRGKTSKEAVWDTSLVSLKVRR